MITHSLEQTLLRSLSRHSILKAQDRCVLAVSGGADSVALLRALAKLRGQLGCQLFVASFNHKLRDGSAEDKDFVESLAQSHQLPFYGEDCQQELKPNGSLEDQARAWRLAFYQRALGHFSATCLATAHHADDQAETVLWRFLMGAPWTQLEGMAWSRPLNPQGDTHKPSGPRLIRPLLACSRDSLRSYLEDLGQDFRHDPSNDDPRFLRNRLRAQWMPQAKTWNPRCLETWGRFATDLRDLFQWLAPQMAELWRALKPRLKDRQLQCQTAPLTQAPQLVARLLLRRALLEQQWPSVSERHLQTVIEALRQPAPRRGQWPGLNWRIESGMLLISRTQEKTSTASEPKQVLLLEDQEVTFAGYQFSLQRVPNTQGLSPNSWPKPALGLEQAWLDGRMCGHDLVIRHSQPGDRIRPLGLSQGSQKLKTLMRARKIPREQRSSIPVVASGSQIIWVVGVEIDDRFKVRDDTDSLTTIRARKILPED